MPPQRSRVMAMWIWYRGDRFRGFQVQVEGPTVQGELARVLGTLGITASPNPSGRTDLGVHARMQVVSVRVPVALEPAEVEAALRGALCEGLGVVCVRAPEQKFHAQWSAVRKQYRYRFTPAAVPPEWEGACWPLQSHPRLVDRALDLDRLTALLERAQGTHDFIAFHGKSSVRKPRTVESATLHRLGGDLLEVRWIGSGFARHQVRFLMGSAILEASGGLPAGQFVEALERGTEIPGLRAPAEGLVLWEVGYPAGTDPFTAEERAHPSALPASPPFRER